MLEDVVNVRVLQLTKFYTPFRGGIESVANELTTGLNARGFNVDVLCANHLPGPTSREVLGDGSRVTRVRSFGKVLSTSIAPVMLTELLRVCGKADVIHVHLPDPLTNFALWAARPSSKLVVHWHSDIVKQKTALMLYLPLQEWLLQRADAIVVTSQAYGETSPWLMPHRHKLHVVPIGIGDVVPPSTESVALVRSRFPGTKLVFSLGRMVYYKGFEYLLEAARHLPPNYSIVIGGSGELLASLQQQCANLRLKNRVFFIGKIPEEEVQTYFAAADLFCLPSTARSEAFGVVLLEAMRAGKPIIATRIEGSGVPWVNQHRLTGLNVPVADGAALAAAIRQVAEDSALSVRYGTAARARFLDTFTAGMMVDQVASLYEHLGHHKPPHPRLHYVES